MDCRVGVLLEPLGCLATPFVPSIHLQRGWDSHLYKVRAGSSSHLLRVPHLFSHLYSSLNLGSFS